MAKSVHLIHPGTFTPDEEYLLDELHSVQQTPVLTPVRFVAYDACPAFVIVNWENQRMRCAREDLYLAAQERLAKLGPEDIWVPVTE